jgi:hypothetical protein
MFDKLKSATGKVATGLSNVQDMAAEQLQSTMDEVNASAPYLARVGYCMLGLQVELGLSPKVILTLSQREVIDPQAFTGVLAEVASRRVLSSILNALQQANALQGKIRVRGYLFRDIEIELGIPPAVRMIFVGAEVVLPTAPASVVSQAADVVAGILSPAEPPQSALEPTTEYITPDPPPLDSDMSAPIPAPDDRTELMAPVAPAAIGPTLPEPPDPFPQPEPVAAPSAPLEPPADIERVIRFRCPGCRVRYKVRPQRAGEALECHRCGKTLTIPSESEAASPA